MNALFVFVGGGIGSLVRYGMSLLIGSLVNSSFPMATLFSNILSTAILALITLQVSNKLESHSWIQPLILIGFCGGFSTFSTFSAETAGLIQSGHIIYAVLNVLLSVTVGIALVYYILYGSN